MPKIDVSPITMCLFNGMFMPAMRATFTPCLVFLALPLLMAFVSTNHPNNAFAPNYLAVSAHFSN